MNRGPKVLVADDELHERQGLRELLDVWGYEAETAGDGQDALNKIAAFNPAS